MVVEPANDERADRLLHALADATRRDIVRRAMSDAHTVSGLARGYPMSFAAVQKHVAVLEKAGLVTKERRGREIWVRTSIDAVRQAAAVLDHLEAVWRARVEQIDALLAETPSDEGAR